MPKPRRSNLDLPFDDGSTTLGEGPNLAERWSRFWFAPADNAALDGIRFLFGIYLVFWLGGVFGHQSGLFGLDGWLDVQAYREISRLPEESRPFVGWSPIFLATSPATTNAIYFGTLGVFALFALGVAVRLTSVLTWLGVVAFTSNPALGFGGDVLLTIVAFYVMFANLLKNWGHSFKLGVLLGNSSDLISWPLNWRSNAATASIGVNLGMRLLQVHLAIAIAACGLFKLQIGEWWAGDALWFPLFHPTNTSVADLIEWKQRNPIILLSLIGVATYATLAWQLAFPFLIWRVPARPWMLAGAVLGLLGCWFVYRLPTYGPVVLIGCLAYVEPATWRTVLDKIRLSRSLERTIDQTTSVAEGDFGSGPSPDSSRRPNLIASGTS